MKKKEMSHRKLNYYITLIAAFLGIAIPQNNIHSEHGNDPIPDDIRANKKEGEEYATIGNVLKNGGFAKILLIFALIVIITLIILKVFFPFGF